MVSLNYNVKNGPVLKNFLFQFKKVNDRCSGNLLPYTLKNVGLGPVETSSNTTSSIAKYHRLFVELAPKTRAGLVILKGDKMAKT